MKFIATCKMGLESVVADELLELGAQEIKKFDARVEFVGSYADMARCLIGLRAAERVLLVVGEFRAVTFTELFDGVKALRLKDYLRRDCAIHVNGKSAKSTLFSVSDCQSIVKKAIVENLRSAYSTNVIPETGAEVIVEVGILNDNATLALDACGAGLSRRGYRLRNYDAPIAESLAAGIILLSKLQRFEAPFVDPMCGSGTFPIEAAMIVKKQAPNIDRDFAAESWHFIDRAVFDDARTAARDAILDIVPEVYGFDIDEKAVQMSKQHAKNAGVMLHFAQSPLSELNSHVSNDDSGIIVCNPPYGERMLDKRAAESLYREMAGVFGALPRWSKHIITSHQEFERAYGKRATKRRNLTNGGKKCTLYSYFRERMTDGER